MLPDLPAEIWLRISSYLPPKDLSKLCLLNHFFHEIAKNYRYENLTLRSYTNDAMRMMKNSRQIPGIAQRVNSLEIHLQAFVWLAEFDQNRPEWQTNLKSTIVSVKWMIDRTIKKDAARSKTVTQITDYLLAAAPEMVNLHSCNFNLLPSRALESYLPFFRKLWSILSPRVRRLTIEAPSSGLHFLPSAFCHLHRLEHLSISLYRNPDQGTKEPEYAASLVTFLNITSPTLESLTITSFPSSPIPGYGPIFEQLSAFESPHQAQEKRLTCYSLGQFKRLKRFNLGMFFDGVVGPSVIQFLNKHSETVKEISLNPDISQDSHITPLSTLNIPDLQMLSVSFASDSATVGPDKFWEGTLRFSMLRDLTIDTPYLFQLNFTAIFSAFRRSESGRRLNTLKLDACTLTGAFFDLLVKTFPALHVLSIRSFWPHLYEPQKLKIENFAKEMATRCYPQWGLYDIALLQHGQGDLSRPNQVSYSAMEIVSRSVPSIQSFCGTGNKDRPRDTWS